MFKDVFKKLFVVRKCARCSNILEFERIDMPFCASCQLEWNAAIIEGCPTCFKPALECECMPQVLSKSGAMCLRRSFFYKSENARNAPMSIIYWLKYKKSRRIVGFVARELCGAVRAELDVLDIEGDQVIFCGVPRSKASRIKYGFDQADMVSKELAQRLNMTHIRAFKSKMRGKKQKELSKRERLKNAKASISLRDNVDVSGKYVVLFDDMVTTGASMAACTSLLLKNGAKGVLCFALSSSTIA